jgi:phosphate transport system protein
VIEQRKAFHHQLDEVRDDIVVVSALVMEVLPRGTEALLTGDLIGADEIIRGDDVIDLRSVDIEDRCFHLLALQQPMAGDLRAIITAIKLVGEIERSGDLVVNICKAARRMYGHSFDPKIRGLITRMSAEALQLFRRALDAYVEGDAPLAAALDDMDDILDQLHGDLIQAIFESHSSGRLDLQTAVQLAVVARFYERIGDHAVNIAERVHYMVTGGHPVMRTDEGDDASASGGDVDSAAQGSSQES